MNLHLLAAVLAGSVNQSATAVPINLPFSEQEPPELNCIYERMLPVDLAATRQASLDRIDAMAREDKAALKKKNKDAARKERDKRTIALSGQCQDQFGLENWQMDGWVSEYTNAKVRAEAIRTFLSSKDSDRIEKAVNSLSTAELIALTDGKKKNESLESGIKLTQAVYQAEEPLDKKALAGSYLYMDSVLMIRGLRVQWIEWQRAEEMKAKAEAARKAQ